MKYNKLAITQILSCLDLLKNREKIENNFDLQKHGFGIIENLTIKQYKYILALVYNDKNEELYNLLESLGFQKKEKEVFKFE